jgi:cytochrome d ubiquinol oxidase subunit II
MNGFQLLGLGLPELTALAMLVALVLYVLLGGADFGGGVWDLLASGPRKRAQRALVEDVIGPVWEVNHIWLILIVVLLFTGFPRGFAIAATALHVPLTLMLIGVVLRGAAFAFRQYDDRRDEVQRRWGRIFAMASIVTPLCLGVCLGAITAGGIRVDPGATFPSTGFFAPWLGVFPFMCGLMTLALFAFVAATYLTCETGEAALADDFRRRALVAGVLVGALAFGAWATRTAGATAFGERLFHSAFSLPLQLVTGAAAVTAFAALVTRRFRLARVAVVVQVAFIVLGWGLAQRPFLVAPDVMLRDVAAPDATLGPVLVALVAGTALLLPALVWLIRTFRVRHRPDAPSDHG